MTDHTPRILIVDDTAPAAELLEAYLADGDYDVRLVGDGETALRTAAEWRPDLVLLDVMMPKLSGFEVCKHLRQSPATRDIPVLMITALDQPSDMERAVEVGAIDFLSKPINKAELVRRVQALLRARRQPGELERTLAYIEDVEKTERP